MSDYFAGIEPGPTPTHDLERAIDSKLHDFSPTQPTTAFLLVIAGDEPGRVFPLDCTSRTIGRSRRADIRLMQPCVSHVHATIIMAGRGHSVSDAGSTNGTFVNDRRVTEEVSLTGGDVIRIGETALTYLSPRSDDGDLPTVAIQYLPPEMVGREQVPLLPPRSRLPRRTRFAAEQEILVRELDEPSFRDFLSRLLRVIDFARRHLRLLVVCTFVAAAAGGASAFLVPPPSTAAFEVRLTPKTAVNPVQQFERATVEFFASAETSFKSPDLVRKTLEALGEKSPKPDAVRRARDGLLFESVGLRTYRGTYADASPSRALAFLEKHVALYRETEVEKTLKVIAAEVDFLRGQLAQGEREVSRIEGELMTFRQKHIDGLPEQAKEQFTSRIALRTRQTELASQLERATLELGLARRRVKGEDPTLERRVESSHAYKTALAEVNGKLGEARASGFGSEHPEVKRLEKQATELQKLSEQTLLTQGTAVEQRTSPVLKAMRERVAELEVERTAAAKELGRVSGLLAGVDRAVRALPEVEAKHAELTRAHDSTKAIVAKLFEQFKATQLQVELERASAAARYEILMAPELVNRSFRKTAALRVAIGALAGLAIALLVAAFFDIRRYVKRMM